MKKILSVILAVMMLFSTIAMGTSAADTGLSDGLSDYHNNGQANNNQVVFIFDLNGGHLRDTYHVHTETGFVDQSDISGTYVMLPRNNGEQTVNNYIVMPVAVAKDTTTHQFAYWVREKAPSDADRIISGEETFYITQDMIDGPDSGVIRFRAVYTDITGGGDTLGTILGILTKVFGAILGILLYSGDTEAGVAMMDKILGGLDL